MGVGYEMGLIFLSSFITSLTTGALVYSARHALTGSSVLLILVLKDTGTNGTRCVRLNVVLALETRPSRRSQNSLADIHREIIRFRLICSSLSDVLYYLTLKFQ